MKVLLIDDNAKQGWEQLLANVFPIINITSASTYSKAIIDVKHEFDLIFLDIRLDAADHKKHKVEEFSGYKILKEIKSDFRNVNFATPIILLTASNKTWNIDAFIDYGVDAFYTKEHPDFVFDKETSKRNFNKFTTIFKVLSEETGPKRKEIHKISDELIDKISKHKYFNDSAKAKNIQNRIVDKLKLGYVYLFKEQSLLEKVLLKTNNESLAFIIYWSILEELVKGFSDLSTWDHCTYKRNSFWKFKNEEYFIEVLDSGKIMVNIAKDPYQELPFIKKFTEYDYNSKEYKKYTGLINLSEQVFSLLAAYSTKDNFRSLAKIFSKINSFRNVVDFIHSDVATIFTKELVRKESRDEAYECCVKVLSFINDILQLNEQCTSTSHT